MYTLERVGLVWANAKQMLDNYCRVLYPSIFTTRVSVTDTLVVKILLYSNRMKSRKVNCSSVYSAVLNSCFTFNTLPDQFQERRKERWGEKWEETV